VVVIDADGVILATNGAPDLWPRTGRILQLKAGARRHNYIKICRQLAARNVPGAQAAFEGIQDVLGKRRGLFDLEYPSTGPAPEWFLLTVTALRGAISGALIAHSDITEIKRAKGASQRGLETTARTYLKEIRALAARLLIVQEEERRRVSRDLHDDICQQLAALTMNVSRVAGYQGLPEKVQRSLKKLRASIIRISEATRHIAYELHPSELEDLGLTASLRALCKEFSRREGIQAAFIASTNLPGFISGEAASCLYRVAQESLQNVAKHSGAKQVTVNLLFGDNVLELTVMDNGSGYNAREARGHGGLGLVGLQERVRLMKGTFAIQSYPGKHTTLTASVPSRHPLKSRLRKKTRKTV
jgi:signal transduction histidine kinase